MCLSIGVNLMPMRRKIIDDSDCDLPSSTIKRSKDAGEGTVAIIVLSSDESDNDMGDTADVADAEIRVGSENPQPATAAVGSNENSLRSVDVEPAHMNALQFAAMFGRFPTPAQCAAARAVNAITPLVQHKDPEGDLEVDDGYLWNALPPKTSQFLDLEAVCVDDSSSGSSGYDDSEDELTPGFVDDLEAEKENLSEDDVELLQRFLPLTAK